MIGRTASLSSGCVLVGILALAPAAPAVAQQVHLEQIGLIAQPAELVRLQGNHAYTVLGRTITVFDITSPATARRAGAYTFPDKIWGVKEVGTLLYAAVDKYGLGILEMANAAQPSLRGSLKTPGQAKSVALIGTTALVADHMAGVDFIDVSNPSKPVVMGSYFLDGYARAVAAIGSIAAAVDAPTGLYLFDFSKPNRFEAVGSEQSADRPGMVEVSSLVGAGTASIAVLVGAGTLQIYDISEPTAPKRVTSFRTPGGRPVRAALRGTRAYVADALEGLHVVDLSVPSTPRVVGTFKTTAPARDVAASDALILVATGRDRGRDSTPEGTVQILRQSARAGQ